ncbi:AAA family ATPase [Streptomyces sp. SID6041]|nr:AAA family ATPase [Streptomyces sp. SID6041]
MGGAAQRFWSELRALRRAAPGPTLEQLVRRGELRSSSPAPSKSTISAWFNGTSVPSAQHLPHLLDMTAFLQRQAANTYVPRTEGQWQTLFRRARDEQDKAQTRGRPLKPRPTPARPDTLPAGAAGFVGRSAELRTILDWLEPTAPSNPDGGGHGDVALLTVAGMGGVGKTELALQAAHQANERGWFTGGALFADVGGYGREAEPTAAALALRFLLALGVKPKDLPAEPDQLLDLWHSHLNELRSREQPVLLVLDNVRTLATVAALVPRTPHRLLLTARHKPAALSGRFFSLAPMGDEEAVDLLASLLRVRDAQDDRVGHQREHARHIVALCGNLPLALRITAALLQEDETRPLGHYAEELRAERTRLDTLAYEDVDREGRPLAVRACFDLSYRYLPDDCKRALRLVAAAPGNGLSAEAAAVLLGQGSRRLLGTLARTHLLGVHSGSRWVMHDLIRLYGSERAEETAVSDGRDSSVDDLYDHYASSLRSANDNLVPGRGSTRFPTAREALAWLDEECDVLIASALSPAAGRRPTREHLGFLLNRYLDMRRRFEDVVVLATDALSRAEAEGSAACRAHALSSMGNALTAMRRHAEAAPLHEQAVSLYFEMNEEGAAAAALVNLGSALHSGEKYQDAYYARTLAVFYFQRTRQAHGRGSALVALAQTLLEIGRPAEGSRVNREGIRILEEVGDVVAAASAMVTEGDIRSRRKAGDSLPLYREAMERLGAAHAFHAQGVACTHLADELARRGSVSDAIDAYGTAARLFRDTGDLVAEDVVLRRISSLPADDV